MDKFSAQFSQTYSKLISKLSGWMNEIILQLPNIALAILVGVIAYFSSKILKKTVVKAAKRFSDNKTIVNLISNLSTVIFTIIVLFMVLAILNLDSTINKILAAAGVLGLAVGLALQDPMNNLFSGVFMSVRKLYKIGDLIESNGHFGTITDIDLRATKLRTPSGQDIVIPNKDVIQNPLKNYSSSGIRRIDLACSVSYGDDLDKVENIAKTALANLDNITRGSKVEIIFSEFGDSSVNFTARYWIEPNSQIDYLKEKSEGIKALKKAFDANEIMIPYPIRTLDFGIKGGVALKQMLPSENGNLKPLSTIENN